MTTEVFCYNWQALKGASDIVQQHLIVYFTLNVFQYASAFYQIRYHFGDIILVGDVIKLYL